MRVALGYCMLYKGAEAVRTSKRVFKHLPEKHSPEEFRGCEKKNVPSEKLVYKGLTVLSRSVCFIADH